VIDIEERRCEDMREWASQVRGRGRSQTSMKPRPSRTVRGCQSTQPQRHFFLTCPCANTCQKQEGTITPPWKGRPQNDGMVQPGDPMLLSNGAAGDHVHVNLRPCIGKIIPCAWAHRGFVAGMDGHHPDVARPPGGREGC
jgi:hypothetical protein